MSMALLRCGLDQVNESMRYGAIRTYHERPGHLKKSPIRDGWLPLKDRGEKATIKTNVLLVGNLQGEGRFCTLL